MTYLEVRIPPEVMAFAYQLAKELAERLVSERLAEKRAELGITLATDLQRLAVRKTR